MPTRQLILMMWAVMTKMSFNKQNRCVMKWWIHLSMMLKQLLKNLCCNTAKCFHCIWWWSLSRTSIVKCTSYSNKIKNRFTICKLCVAGTWYFEKEMIVDTVIDHVNTFTVNEEERLSWGWTTTLNCPRQLVGWGRWIFFMLGL